MGYVRVHVLLPLLQVLLREEVVVHEIRVRKRLLLPLKELRLRRLLVLLLLLLVVLLLLLLLLVVVALLLKWQLVVAVHQRLDPPPQAAVVGVSLLARVQVGYRPAPPDGLRPAGRARRGGEEVLALEAAVHQRAEEGGVVAPQLSRRRRRCRAAPAPAAAAAAASSVINSPSIYTSSSKRAPVL